jgi:hypothetical protein
MRRKLYEIEKNNERSTRHTHIVNLIFLKN